MPLESQLVSEIPENIPLNDECRLLLELKDHSRIFARIAESSESELRLQAELRKDYASGIVSAAIAQAELRRKASQKFDRSGFMWFDRQGLEQATAEIISRHKSERFSGEVWDLCCGVGGDSISLAQNCFVQAVDVNPANCLRTWSNADVYECQKSLNVHCEDVTSLNLSQSLVHIDPDRRPGAKRVIRIEDAEPGLDYLQELIRVARGGAIKLSPASNFIGKFPAAEIELTSFHGECKEATVWFGELRGTGVYRATSLPSGETIAGDPLMAYCHVSPLQKYLFDPDPAIVRSGLIELLAEQYDLYRLDDAEEYLTGDHLPDTAFLRSFEVIDHLPYRDKEIRKYFRKSDFGQLEIKCRHIKVPIESLRRKLDLSGEQAGVLVVARERGNARAVICRRLD